MSDELTAERFIEALRQAESDDDVDGLVALFADDGVCGNGVGGDAESHGPEGAREFWEQDQQLFGAYESDFRNAVEGDGVIALEWTRSNGEADDEFSGVSVIEHADGKINRFYAYFDPNAAAG